jgi:proline iminopeptidase
MTYPPIDLFDAGLLSVAGNEIYWEISGNPDGKPALYLHGGPGSALRSGYRRRFDPQKYRVVGIDQRGCGQSRPLATDALGELHRNTTQTLIEDIEAVRGHLDIETWLVSGVSWGTTLALAYAQAYPGRVSELVLLAVTTTSREEVDWITEGVGRIFPESWQRFEQASGRRDDERIVEAYARRLATGDTQERLGAARAWNDWESTHISLDPNWVSIDQRFDEERFGIRDPRHALLVERRVSQGWKRNTLPSVCNRAYSRRSYSWSPRHQRASDSGLASPSAVAGKPLVHRGIRRAWRAPVDGTDARRA